MLELGAVKEYDTPRNLLLDPTSEFTSMVHETGPQNEATLRNIAIHNTADKADELQRLADLAATKLATKATQEQFSLGPLMRMVRDCALAFELGWEERRAPKWENELREQDVSLSQWLQMMNVLRERVNTTAEAVLEMEHLDFKSGAYGPGEGRLLHDDTATGQTSFTF